MKPLTLTQLRKAIKDCPQAISPMSKKMDSATAGAFGSAMVSDLKAAEAFLTGASNTMPRDPRVVLTEIGYKW